MSLPNLTEKYHQLVIIKPGKVIEERQKSGMNPTMAISDVLAEDGWHQSYYSDEKTNGLRQIFVAAVETLSSFHAS